MTSVINYKNLENNGTMSSEWHVYYEGQILLDKHGHFVDTITKLVVAVEVTSEV